MKRFDDDATRLIARATRRGGGRRTVAPPIERGSTLLNDDPAAMRDEAAGPVYGIQDLSAARELAEALCELEGASLCVLAPSGLSALTLPLTALLRPGDEVLAPDALYGPTRRFLTRRLAAWGVTTRFHPASADAEAILDLVGPATRLLLIEAPSSLTFEMADVPALARGCRARGVLTVMDNTWSAGLAFRPLAHGVDVSVQALTKYVGGHSDLLMGASLAADPVIARRLADTHEDFGSRVAADEAWLALRGLRTLPLRYRTQGEAGLKVAAWLAERPEVARVLHPALPSDPGHGLWARDWSGCASVFGVVMEGGSTASAHALMRALNLFGLGYSWGGFESLITHETGQLAFRADPPRLEGELMRLHVGLENLDDLIADLEAGLSAWRAAL